MRTIAWSKLKGNFYNIYVHFMANIEYRIKSFPSYPYRNCSYINGGGLKLFYFVGKTLFFVFFCGAKLFIWWGKVDFQLFIDQILLC